MIGWTKTCPEMYVQKRVEKEKTVVPYVRD